MENKKAIAHVSERKKEIVKELKGLIKNSKTILVCSIKGIPASQFQEIKKSLRDYVKVKVPKKSLMTRAIDESEKKEIKKIKDVIEEQFTVLFSDMDGFDLASDLLKTKTPAKAKPGQEAPEDIEIQAGPTDLVPGPAVSELGAMGIQIKIEKGKINIQAPKVIAKKGEEISEQAADLMSKLDIKPFSIGFTPLVIFDNEKNTVYFDIDIDPEKYIDMLKQAYSKALPFAVEIGYYTDETVRIMIAKAESHAKKLNKIITGEPDEPAPSEEAEVTEESSEKAEKTEEKEEEKTDTTAGLASLFG
ncbi:MAG: 50S ribosomal protein L10 [Minisyncoccales bacterium]